MMEKGAYEKSPSDCARGKDITGTGDRFVFSCLNRKSSSSPSCQSRPEFTKFTFVARLQDEIFYTLRL